VKTILRLPIGRRIDQGAIEVENNNGRAHGGIAILRLARLQARFIIGTGPANFSYSDEAIGAR
jgi:hypothetical protein